MTTDRWPALSLEEWSPTYETLHRWTQIVGKTRLFLSPFQNHWWNCTLYMSARGMTTSPMPYGDGTLEIEFDFLADLLVARTSDGRSASLALTPRSVADFYHEYRALLDSLNVVVHIVPTPNEMSEATPFPSDNVHAAYDASAVRRVWTAMLDAHRVLSRFRSTFAGKCSPVHFWWGGFDLACTRFSGRTAPEYAGSAPNTPRYVMREGYSRECISAGWWPGGIGSPVPYPAFYAYAYPEPPGCAAARIEPAGAFFHPEMREWILPYDVVRRSTDPDATTLRFFEDTYRAGATLAGWDIEALSAKDPRPTA